MNLYLARLLEEQITNALRLADANGLADLAIKLNEALVLVNGVGSGPPAQLGHGQESGELLLPRGCKSDDHR